MSYAEKFIKSKGQDCIIERTIPVNTKVSIKRSTNGTRDLGAREAFWQGLIPIEDNLQSGEYLSIKGKKYLVQTVSYDHASKECAFYCAKCNSVIQHKRLQETTDENYNIVVAWTDVNSNMVDIPSYSEIVTYRMRQEEVGLLDSTKYTFQVPKSVDVKELDRFVFNGENLRVDSIDPTSMENIVKVQTSSDVRE